MQNQYLKPLNRLNPTKLRFMLGLSLRKERTPFVQFYFSNLREKISLNVLYSLFNSSFNSSFNVLSYFKYFKENLQINFRKN